MGSIFANQKPHAVCIPYPAQGHINPMLKVAKLLHQKGFHITFVNTEFNHKRLLKSRGPNSLNGLPTFRFKTIPDGLPPTDVDATQDIPMLCESTSRTCLAPFKELLSKLNESNDTPPITCIVSDGVMSFTIDAAEEFDIPEVFFWTTSACGLLAYLHYHDLVEKGYIPFKDASYLTNGDLDTIIDWIPGMNNIRLKDIPTFIRTTNPDDIMLNFLLTETKRVKRANAIILNTFEALEHQSLTSLASLLPPIYPIGPLNLISNQVTDKDLNQLGSNLWAEETECLDWLDTQEPNSVVYVNFGSITVMTSDQLVEFAWGLANSKKSFLWVIRPDLVSGESAILPSEFLSETKNRGILANWCPQEQVLHHSSVGGFLTHSGWNSTIESITGGVPMVCWPFFAEQQTNCRYCCVEWGIGMEIDSDVTRGEVERLVKELMDGGDEGKRMRAKAAEWKKLAQDGASCKNLDAVINHMFLN